jgi:hypothetical protein
MSKIKYEIGSLIGNVTYLGDVNSDYDRKAKFKCFCGNEFVAFLHSVKSMSTKSCGCYRRKYMKEKKTSHGMSYHPLYNVYNNMINRCYNKKDKSYTMYGGRGVMVCEEWRNNPNSFYDWAINNGWKDGLQLDKDIKGNSMEYSPLNCIFVTPKENSNKRRSSVYVTHNSETKTISEWADFAGIKNATLHSRYKKGIDFEKCLKK